METIARNEERFKQENIFDPARWGLSQEAINTLGESLAKLHDRYRPIFITTNTRDSSQYARTYVHGLLDMDAERNYANIARKVNGPDDDGQNIQHFMSNSTWDARKVFVPIQQEVQQYPHLEGGMLTLDDSGDKRAGGKSAGAARQYIGRLGKVDMGQVGVLIGYFQQRFWTVLDAALYIPEKWFSPAYEELRRKCGIPASCQFKTKIEMALEMVLDARSNGVPFEIVGCDSGYGANSSLRGKLQENNILYLAGIKSSTRVYLEPPVVNFVFDRQGRERIEVSSEHPPCMAGSLVGQLEFFDIPVRQAERGLQVCPCASRLVWTVAPSGRILQEWLFIRKEPDKYTFSLCNAPADTPIERLASWRSARYFVERTIQDAKSDLGWDELEAHKYSSWMHHAALCALALWFLTAANVFFTGERSESELSALLAPRFKDFLDRKETKDVWNNKRPSLPM